MVRTQAHITVGQKRSLRKRAALTGMSEAEIVRRGIERELEQPLPVAEDDDWKDAWRQAFGMWKDRDDIEVLYAERRERRRKRRQKARGTGAVE
jgi:hypothetical protein